MIESTSFCCKTVNVYKILPSSIANTRFHARLCPSGSVTRKTEFSSIGSVNSDFPEILRFFAMFDHYHYIGMSDNRFWSAIPFLKGFKS